VSPRHRVFGVVVTVPPEVGRRADRVRRFYDPNYARIGPHVTVLPPRPLALTRGQVLSAVERVARRADAFSIRLGPIRTFFPVMPVVFASIRLGRSSLIRLHRRLDRGALNGPTPFPYVPHLTLGQALDRSRLDRSLRLSRRIFSEGAATAWVADRLVVVERVTETRWINLPPLLINLRKTTRRRSRRRSGGNFSGTAGGR
jgi:2'-5' RNA ligase